MVQRALRYSKEVFLEKLTGPSRTEIVELASRRHLEKDDFLCHQGHLWPNVVLLASGKLTVIVLSPSGQEYNVVDIKPGEFFWGHTVFDDKPLPASLKATEPSELFCWPAESLLPVLFRNPEAMWEVFRSQVKFMRHASEIIFGLAFQPVAARLAKLLLNTFAEQEGATIKRTVPLAKMASLVNSSPEVVCRLLCRFQKEGILEVTRTSITLQNEQALKRINEAPST